MGEQFGRLPRHQCDGKHHCAEEQRERGLEESGSTITVRLGLERKDYRLCLGGICPQMHVLERHVRKLERTRIARRSSEPDAGGHRGACSCPASCFLRPPILDLGWSPTLSLQPCLVQCLLPKNHASSGRELTVKGHGRAAVTSMFTFLARACTTLAFARSVTSCAHQLTRSTNLSPVQEAAQCPFSAKHSLSFGVKWRAACHEREALECPPSRHHQAQRTLLLSVLFLT